eukprot:augustus_masked-scaffold_55-processed-gene-1.61-mRNA-1 protein AED:1.00 eAED:1.00 QI:0/0/0/0/1/1/2/0/500
MNSDKSDNHSDKNKSQYSPGKSFIQNLLPKLSETSPKDETEKAKLASLEEHANTGVTKAQKDLEKSLKDVELAQKATQMTPYTRNRRKEQDTSSLLGYDELSLLRRRNKEKRKVLADKVSEKTENIFQMVLSRRIEKEVDKRLAIALGQMNMETSGKYTFPGASDEDVAPERENANAPVPDQVGDPVEDNTRAAPGAPDDGGDDNTSASTRSTKASWSVTGSTFNGTAYSSDVPHLRFPRPPVAQHQVESGVPFVQFSLPKKLNDLKERSIENFLYEYFSVRTNVPNLRIQGLLSRQVYSVLQFRKVDVKSDLKILASLQSHLIKHEAKKKENSLTILRKSKVSTKPKKEAHSYEQGSLNKTPVERVSLSAVGAGKLRDIELLMKDPGSGSFQKVKGIADTGAERNMSTLEVLGKFVMEVEDPRYVLEVEFPDKTVHPVHKVAKAYVMLVQKDLQVDLGKCIFFCVKALKWDDIIIEKKTLDRFRIKLELVNSKKAERRK